MEWGEPFPMFDHLFLVSTCHVFMFPCLPFMSPMFTCCSFAFFVVFPLPMPPICDHPSCLVLQVAWRKKRPGSEWSSWRAPRVELLGRGLEVGTSFEGGAFSGNFRPRVEAVLVQRCYIQQTALGLSLRSLETHGDSINSNSHTGAGMFEPCVRLYRTQSLICPNAKPKA